MSDEDSYEIKLKIKNLETVPDIESLTLKGEFEISLRPLYEKIAELIFKK